jgi:hypothetical protein
VSNPYADLDRLVRDFATLSGQYEALKLRVEKLEARQAHAFGPDASMLAPGDKPHNHREGGQGGSTLHLPPRKQ